MDEPEDLGGTNASMNPVEALLCALGTCQTIVASAFASANGITFEEFHVKIGDKIAADDVVAQVETAKGNRPIKATIPGVISRILCEEGTQIASNAEMFEIDESGISKESKETDIISEAQKNSKEITTDLLVIGAGPGEYVAAIYVAKRRKMKSM